MAIITVKFIPDDDLTIFTVDGDLSVEDILKFSSEYATKNVLWDATNGSVRNIHTDDFRRIAVEMKKQTHKRAGGKTALVGSLDVDFGLSRMYEAFAGLEKIPITYGAFRNYNDAMNWLKE